MCIRDRKKGRRVELTQYGQRLVDKISPILSELRDMFIEERSASGELVIGVSDAILSSWGPCVFHEIKKRCQRFHLFFTRTERQLF